MGQGLLNSRFKGSSREISSSQSCQLAYYLNRVLRIIVLESRVQGGGFLKVFFIFTLELVFGKMKSFWTWRIF